jgi:hypothetical protein
MKYKLKVKPSKELGHKFEPFEIEIEEIGWDQRVIINDEYQKAIIDKELNFSFWSKIIFNNTHLTKEELHKYSYEEIHSFALTLIEEANKKK